MEQVADSYGYDLRDVDSGSTSPRLVECVVYQMVDIAALARVDDAHDEVVLTSLAGMLATAAMADQAL